MDDEAVNALNQASKTFEAKMKELVRHHQFVEKLENDRLELKKRERRENLNLLRVRSTNWTTR
jgi:mRNA-degrading endonuclease RelE of RelBE toxin-antitoxin system